jgi:competence protein ComEC
MLLVSLAATLGTMPIMLYHFNMISIIGPLMNLIIEPLLCLWALPFGLMAIPLLWIAPDLAILLLHCGGLGIQLTIWITEQVAGWPFASIWTITPHPLEICLFYIIILLILSSNQTRRRLALAAGLTVMLLGSFTWSLWRPNSDGEMTVTFLDVGQGTATLLKLPNGANVLIDGGGTLTERFDPGRNLIAPFLWRNRIWRLDDLIVTHPHQDHYNGLPFVAERFHPRRLIINGDRGDEPAYGHFLENIRGKGIPIKMAVAGDVLQHSEDLRLTCFGMKKNIADMPSWSINDRSLVLGLLYKERSFLFPGDISLLSENKLMQGNDHLGGDVLLAPHHGSRTSSGQDFIARVSPALVVVSAGRTRQGTLPAPEHLDHWRQNNILALVTAQKGTITCTTDGRSLSASTFTGEHYSLEVKGRRDLPGERGLTIEE